MSKTLINIVKEICEEDKIKYSLLSKDLVIMLEKDGKTRFISGYKFDLNSQGTGLIVDDKYALYDVLKSKKIHVVEHKIVYDVSNKNSYAIGCNTHNYVKDYFIKNNNHIVIKPNDGTRGKNVFNVTDINQIDKILDNIFTNSYSISMCPFYDIKNEHRVIIVNGEIMLLYTKYLPIVIGNGKKSIRELLLEFNNVYFKNKLSDSKYDRILKNKEIFQYNWKFNLSQGSIAKKIENDKLKVICSKIAKDVADTINLNFGTIDIIETKDNEFLVLEANSGLMMENYIRLNPDDYKIVKEIYKKAIDELFS